MKLSHSGELCLPSLPFCLQAWLCFKFWLALPESPGSFRVASFTLQNLRSPAPAGGTPCPAPRCPPLLQLPLDELHRQNRSCVLVSVCPDSHHLLCFQHAFSSQRNLLMEHTYKHCRKIQLRSAVLRVLQRIKQKTQVL